MRLTFLALAATLIGCGSTTTEDPPAPPAAAEPAPEAPAPEKDPNLGEWEPSADQQKVYDRLKVKKPEPACKDVETGVSDALGAFRGIVEHVTTPPWVPMRAATCLINGHAKDIEPDALKWVADPEQTGLTTVVLGRLDTLPLAMAKTIATAALAGPHKDLAKTRISRLRTQELKDLATGVSE
jgi:hypothetical protein